MADVFDIYTIIFLALAVFIFLRLRSVLGQRTGRERPPYDPYSARDAVRSPAGEKVVTLPQRNPDAAQRSAETATSPAERWKDVAEGGSALDPDVVARLVGRRKRSSPLDTLTKRESEVLALIAEGYSNAGVAAELVVTVAAVERHVTSIFDKLGLHQSPDQHRRVLAVLNYHQS